MTTVQTIKAGFLAKPDAPDWAFYAFHWCHLLWAPLVLAWAVTRFL